MRKRLLHAWAGTLLCAALLGLPWPARAELVVIVNPQSGVDQLTRSQVINIFLGNHREFPNGLRARPFDLPTGNPDKELVATAWMTSCVSPACTGGEVLPAKTRRDQYAAIWFRSLLTRPR